MGNPNINPESKIMAFKPDNDPELERIFVECAITGSHPTDNDQIELLLSSLLAKCRTGDKRIQGKHSHLSGEL